MGFGSPPQTRDLNNIYFFVDWVGVSHNSPSFRLLNDILLSLIMFKIIHDRMFNIFLRKEERCPHS